MDLGLCGNYSGIDNNTVTGFTGSLLVVYFCRGSYCAWRVVHALLLEIKAALNMAERRYGCEGICV